MLNVAQNQEKPWYQRVSDGSGLRSRVEQINKYRSPHTKADEILRILRWVVQPLLVGYCMVLSFSSYQAFFGHNFSPVAATLAAVTLCVVIEFGKIKIGGYVFQKPFLEGVGGLRKSFAEFSVWFGALLFAGATFIMSVINSTSGAHALSMMKGHEKNEMSFTVNTADIDKQIADTDARIKQNAGIKWKGTVTYQAQKAINADTKTLQGLQRQKEAATNAQRADFERARSISDDNTSTGANVLMASGGWVEILQGITLFFIAACMSVLGGVMDKDQQRSVGFNNIQSNQGNGRTNVYNNDSDTKIGFYWKGYGDQTPSQPHTVPQHQNTVPQPTHEFIVSGCDATLIKCENCLRRNIPHFNNAQARPATVSGRINSALDECLAEIRKAGFQPSYSASVKLYNYTNSAFEQLKAKGWPYDREQEFVNRLREVIPAS